jgi:hypothetical protein
MNILKWIAHKILKEDIDRYTSMALVLEEFKEENWRLATVIRHHERRINDMAPEKQFLVVAVDGTVLSQEMVYSSDGRTRITVRLPQGHPWQQATELAQQLELANLTIDRAKATINDDAVLRRKFLGLDQPTNG